MPIQLLAMYAVWTLWAISWFAAALWTNKTVGRPDSSSQLPYRVITVVGAVLMFALRVRDPLHSVFGLWQVGPDVAWAMVALAVAGFAFSWWARLHLGRLWSSSVTKKTDHHVIDTGPYRLVRHPIYTGIIIASVGVVVLKGTVFALAGALILTLGWYVKARLEERFLRQELGVDAYNAYAARTPMLIPFLKF